MSSSRLISESSEWTFPMLEHYNEVIGHIAAEMRVRRLLRILAAQRAERAAA